MIRYFIHRILFKGIIMNLFRVVMLVIGMLFFAHTVLHAAPNYDAFTVKVTGKGQPVILIPGATCAGAEWDATVARYSSRYQCHVLTLAGYAGTKPLPHGPYLQTIKEQIERYITEQKLNDVILVGHSIGGFLSLCIATDMKDHLQKVIVVDAMPFFAGARNPSAPDTFSAAAAEKLFANYSSMDDEKMRASQLQTAQFLCRDSTYWSTIAEWGVKSDKRTFAYTITEMMSNDMRQEISEIKVPVLVLVAYCAMPEYPMYSREYVTMLFSGQYKACKTCTLSVAEGEAKHFIMYDAPQWYFSQIDNFIGKK